MPHKKSLTTNVFLSYYRICIFLSSSFGDKPEKKAEWEKRVSRAVPGTNELKTFSSRSVLCSLHFDLDCFKGGDYKRNELKDGANPTILPERPSYMTPKTVKERNPKLRDSKEFPLDSMSETVEVDNVEVLDGCSYESKAPKRLRVAIDDDNGGPWDENGVPLEGPSKKRKIVKKERIYKDII